MDISNAVEKLDADIRDTERRLESLRQMRVNIVPFFKTYVGSVDMDTDVVVGEGVLTANPQGATEAVLAAFQERQGVVLSVQDVMTALEARGRTFERGTVRNSIHYATRKNLLRKGNRRGTFVMPASEQTTASTEASVEAEAAIARGGESNRHVQDHGVNKP